MSSTANTNTAASAAVLCCHHAGGSSACSCACRSGACCIADWDECVGVTVEAACGQAVVLHLDAEHLWCRVATELHIVLQAAKAQQAT